MSQKAVGTKVYTPRWRGSIVKELKRIHLYILPILWSLFNIFCVYWIVVSSLKTNKEVFRAPWGCLQVRSSRTSSRYGSWPI